jgi:signal transduction histidine kinase
MNDIGASTLWMVASAIAGTLALLSLRYAWRLHRREQRARLAHQQEFDARVALLRNQAAAEERERIFSDLHDDLGSKLLQIIYSAPTPEHADAARAVLQDLRDVVSRSRGEPGTLGDVLAELRAEAQARLTGVGIALDWQQPDRMPDPRLDHARALHLFRIVREAISNVIRHAQAERLRVRVRASDSELQLELTDDGSGAAVGVDGGRGMHNMRCRAATLDGDIEWKPGTQGGTKVRLAIPLDQGVAVLSETREHGHA